MTRMLRLLPLLLLPLHGVQAGQAPSQPADQGNTSLASFAFHQHPGALVQVDAPVREETGRVVTMREVMDGRPAILALGYFHCPNLCGVTRDDLFSALSRSSLRTPADYSVLTLSIDPSETPSDAAKAKVEALARYPVPGAGRGWHFLTADAAVLRLVQSAVGFPSRYDPQMKQFLHPSGLVFLTPGGKVSGYLLGVGYQPGDLAADVARAARGGVAAAAVPVLLLCFHYDPATGRYSLAIVKLLRLFGFLTVLTVGGMMYLAYRREGRR